MRALDKAQNLAADALIFDLEDAVAPDAKAEARTAVLNACTQNDYGQRVRIIRVNAHDTPWGIDDLDMAYAAHPDIVLIPKVATSEDIAFAREHLVNGIALWAMIELPISVLRIEELVANSLSYGLSGLVMGTNDLAKELGAQFVPSRTPLMSALSLCLLAARAHGLVAIDGVFNDIDDAQGFADECAQSVAMGFDGKTLIHPSQLDVANSVYRPQAEELAQARAIVAAFALPENANKGVLRVAGKMVEILHLKRAHKLIARADAIIALEQENR